MSSSGASHHWMSAALPFVSAAVLGIAAIAGMAAPAAPVQAPPAAPSKYVGTKRCKMCHSAKEGGDAYGQWAASKHASAWKSLDSDAARAAAKERGLSVAPQEAAECLRCHVTGHGEKPERFDKTFDPKDGVSCESCHGPGEAHVRGRLKWAMANRNRDKSQRAEVPAGEIVSRPEPTTCLQCHNSESPTFKGFCFRERIQQILHDDPRHQRDPAEIEARKCACEKPCTCTKADCGGWPTEAEVQAAKERLAQKKDE